MHLTTIRKIVCKNISKMDATYNFLKILIPIGTTVLIFGNHGEIFTKFVLKP